MDAKCVRVLRLYGERTPDEPMTLLIDEDARYALNKEWGEKVTASGRREATVVIAPLEAMDQQGYIARAGQALMDALYIEYGEEILLR